MNKDVKIVTILCAFFYFCKHIFKKDIISHFVLM